MPEGNAPTGVPRMSTSLADIGLLKPLPRPLEEDEGLEQSFDFLLDIIIPPPLFSPLPLQCLAANALPSVVKTEIAGLITQCCIEQGVTLDDDVDNSEGALVRPADDCAVIERILLTRQPGSDQANDLGIGMKITGGVQCNCGSLHAVVTSLDKARPESPELQEGICVVEWCGVSLEHASFEQVRKVFKSTVDVEEVEVAIKECRLLAYNQRWKVANEQMKMNMCSNSPEYPLVRENPETILPEHLPNEPFSVSMPLSKITTTCELSSPFRTPLERSTSEPPHSAASTISSSSSTVDGAISRRASKLMRSPVGDGGEMEGFGHFFTSLPLGMVKLSLTYSNSMASLSVQLRQVKVNTIPDTHLGKMDHFINAYFLPDNRKQGVRSYCVQSDPALHDSVQAFLIEENEFESTALRVILWQQGTGKGGSPATFLGEVLLSLTDNGEVFLDGTDTWYPVCQKDPNLPQPPTCVHYKKQKEYLLTRFKRSLNQRQEKALLYLKQYIKSSELLSIMSGQDDEQSDGQRTLARKKDKGSKLWVKLRSAAGDGSTISVHSEDSSRHGSKTLAKSKLSVLLAVMRRHGAESKDEELSFDDEAEEGCSTLDCRRRESKASQTGPFASTLSPLKSTMEADKSQQLSVYNFLEELGSTLEAGKMPRNGQSRPTLCSPHQAPLLHHYHDTHAAQLMQNPNSTDTLDTDSGSQTSQHERIDVIPSTTLDEDGCSNLDRRCSTPKASQTNLFVSPVPSCLGADKSRQISLYSFLEELGSTPESSKDGQYRATPHQAPPLHHYQFHTHAAQTVHDPNSTVALDTNTISGSQILQSSTTLHEEGCTTIDRVGADKSQRMSVYDFLEELGSTLEAGKIPPDGRYRPKAPPLHHYQLDIPAQPLQDPNSTDKVGTGTISSSQVLQNGNLTAHRSSTSPKDDTGAITRANQYTRRQRTHLRSTGVDDTTSPSSLFDSPLQGSMGVGKSQRISLYDFLEELGSSLEAGKTPHGDQRRTKLRAPHIAPPLHHYQLDTHAAQLVQDPNRTAKLDNGGSHISQHGYLDVHESSTSPKEDTATITSAAQHTMTQRANLRTRSVDDMLDLDYDDKASDLPRSCQDTTSTVSSLAMCTEGEECSDETTSLDFGKRYSITRPQNMPSTSYSLPRDQEREGLLEKPGHYGKLQKISKWRSLDDVLGSPNSKQKTKKVKLAQSRPSSSTYFIARKRENGRSMGSMKLDLTYDESPPLLIVTLKDVLLLPSKGFAGEVAVKVVLFQNSNGTLVKKEKSIVSLKRDSTPYLAKFDFYTYTMNLSLQVKMTATAKRFSRKVSAVATVNLDTLHFSRSKRSCSHWYPLVKGSIF